MSLFSRLANLWLHLTASTTVSHGGFPPLRTPKPPVPKAKRSKGSFKQKARVAAKKKRASAARKRAKQPVFR